MIVSSFDVVLFNWQEKFNVKMTSLNPMYTFFSNLAHLFITFVRQKYVKFNNFHQPVLKLLASKG